MKKYISLLLCAALLAGLFCGCSGGSENPAEKKKSLSVVAAIFPEYHWVLQVLGEKAASADVTLLLDSGVDLHSFQPTADDIIKISTCDVFIYTGGESDGWAADALKEAQNQNMTVLNLLELLGENAAEEKLLEGMQTEDAHEAEEENEIEYDEHVWLSLKNAAVFIDAIKSALAQADPGNAETYSQNAESYKEKLAALDAEYRSVTENAKRNTLLFADRFPFCYLADDYSLNCYAAFSGCSAESEAAFETVAFLADKLNECSLPCVLTLEGSDAKLAQTVIETAKAENIKILTLDSLQSTLPDGADSGKTYLSVMQANLETLKTALN